jgi:hypothetical protein
VVAAQVAAALNEDAGLRDRGASASLSSIAVF